MSPRIFILGVCLSLVPVSIAAQQPNPFIGSWERVPALAADGTQTQVPPNETVMFTPDGFFVQARIPSGRPKLSKPLSDMTKEELLARFNGVTVRRGVYAVSGNRFTRTEIDSDDPSREGRMFAQQFRVEGDTLVILDADDGKTELARWKRMTAQ